MKIIENENGENFLTSRENKCGLTIYVAWNGHKSFELKLRYEINIGQRKLYNFIYKSHEIKTFF